MSQVNVINVIAHNAKALFLNPISFEIFFEALQPLKHGKYSALIHGFAQHHFSLYYQSIAFA